MISLSKVDLRGRGFFLQLRGQRGQVRYELELRAMGELKGSVGFEIGVSVQAFCIVGLGPAVTHYNFIPVRQVEYHQIYL